METFYLFLVIFLFVLAVFDLSVGVSNDAVNFLNSAIGSRAASFKTIMVIAAIGIFVGASLSNGMMDIARHGIYQPQHFFFSEIMCILLAVMLTDVVLLDIFNSLGMPTSTTVSLVFELLGGTVALSLVKIANSNGALQLGDLLNTDKAFTVILAIFLSVAIAFFFGSVVQYISRLIFTFNYKKHTKYFIALFGGLAVVYVSKDWKIALAPLLFMVVLFLCVPSLASSVGVLVPVGSLLAIGVARILYKKGLL